MRDEDEREQKRRATKYALPAVAPEIHVEGGDHARPSGVYGKVAIEPDATRARSSRQTGQEAPMVPRRKRPVAFAIPTILVVDDDAFFRRVLGDWLARALPTRPVMLAANLTEARAALAATPMFAILLDISLKNETGLDLLRELRDGGDMTPVLVVTGDIDDARIRAAARFSTPICPKPLAQDEVIAFVQRAIDYPPVREIAARFLAIEGELTTEQAEVLLVMLVHESMQDIADAHGSAYGTAKVHVKDVLKKLGAGTRITVRHIVDNRMNAGPARLAKQA